MTWVTLTWNGYTPKCQCGWTGLATTTYKMANRSATAHVRRMHS